MQIFQPASSLLDCALLERTATAVRLNCEPIAGERGLCGLTMVVVSTRLRSFFRATGVACRPPVLTSSLLAPTSVRGKHRLSLLSFPRHHAAGVSSTGQFSLSIVEKDSQPLPEKSIVWTD